MKYYSCTQALSYGTPFVFSLGNRSIGKTFSYTSYVINRYKRSGRKFLYMRRYDDDLRLVVPSFFDNISKKYVDTALSIDGSGKSGTLFKINGDTAGMAVSLSKAIKYKSVNLSEFDTIMYDEFLPEDGRYLSDEVSLALNFYQSVARGFNQPIRPDVKFIFIANNVTVNNPYFIELKIRDQLSLGTRYCVSPDRGWVVEFTNNEGVADAIMQTPFGKMIAKTKYGEYSLKSQFYLDDYTFITKPTGASRYYCNLSHNGKLFAVYEYVDEGLFFISRKVDKTFSITFSLTTDDHKPNYLLIYKNRQNPMFAMLKFAYENALLRFDCADSKIMFLDFMQYSIM